MLVLLAGFLINSGVYARSLSYLSKENNPNVEFNQKPVLTELSINILLDSMVFTEFMIW
ncbi:MAG: hypothetical protein U0V72_15755 [Cytophagales bacterium]